MRLLAVLPGLGDSLGLVPAPELNLGRPGLRGLAGVRLGPFPPGRVGDPQDGELPGGLLGQDPGRVRLGVPAASRAACARTMSSLQRLSAAASSALTSRGARAAARW